MKFDPREINALVRPPQPLHGAPRRPWRGRATEIVETLVLACLAAYFAAGVVGILLA